LLTLGNSVVELTLSVGFAPVIGCVIELTFLIEFAPAKTALHPPISIINDLPSITYFLFF
jgi:hypothetical protein